VPVLNEGPIVPPLRGLAYRMSDNPALLYETATPAGTYYVNAIDYVPPNTGRPWGAMLQNNLGTFYEQKTQWREHGAWHAMNAPVEGPCTVAFFASVQQPNPSALPSPPFTPPATFYSEGLSPEWQFIFNFPFSEDESTGVLIWRVAGALVVELDT